MIARPSRRRPLAGALAGACLLFALPIVAGLRAGAQDPEVAVTATPTTDLSDGQLVTVNVRSSGPDVAAARLQLCRSGVDYRTQTGPQPNKDFLAGGDNCANAPVTSSADVSRIEDQNVQDNARRPEGASIRFRVGVGVASWINVNDGTTQESFRCTPEEGCSLVIELRYGSPTVWHPVVIPLTFRQDDALAGCGGAHPDAVLGAGSDRMKDAWIDWTLAECHLPGRSKAATKPSFNGEGPGIKAFTTGRADLVYTAAGYGDEVGLLEGTDPADLRPSVAVPVAINASVLAVAGGYRDAIGNKVPYTDLRLRPDEVAGLFTAGPSGIQPHLDEVYARNPQLNGNFFDNGGSTSVIAVAAPAEAEAESWVFTDYLARLAPGAWKVPDNSAFGDDAGKPRAATAALATANPTFAGVVATLTGRPPLASANAKIVGNPRTVGGMWVLTDLETATALGMTPVALGNAAGEFVPVTEDTVRAGVASMHETDNGFLLPDPRATAKVDGVTPYPLTMVEYALVPAEPLVDDDCVLRTGSQQLLDGWLQYLTGPGQDQLPPGMYPLPDPLRQRAAAQLQLVGRAETTGDCAGKVTSPDDDGGTSTGGTGGTTGGATTSGGTGGSGTTGAGTDGGTGGSSRTSRTSRSGSRTTVAAPAVQPSNPADDTTGGDEVALVSVPAFAGRRGVPWLPMVAALLGVTALSGLAAVASGSRRSPVAEDPGP